MSAAAANLLRRLLTDYASGALPESCHRRIIADYLLAQGVSVMHIMGSGKVDPAKLTPGARVLSNGALVYPAPEEAIQEKD